MKLEEVKIRRLKGQTLELKIRITKELRVRIFICKLLLRLAAWVLGMKSEILIEKDVK